MEKKYIYSLNCPIYNIPMYIGQTNNPKNRIYKHIYNAKKEGRKQKVYAWIRSLINKGFYPTIEILEECDSNDVDFWEQHYISLYKSWGFTLKNIALGGQSRRIVSLETRNKLRQANLGKKHSAETIEKRRVSVTKAWKSEELRDIQRQRTIKLNKLGITGNKGKVSAKKGKPFSGDKKKLSISLKKHYSNNGGSPKRFNPTNPDELIALYNDKSIPLSEISKKYGVSRTTITSFIKSKGLPFRNQKNTEEQIKTIQELVNNGKTEKEIGIIIGCTHHNIQRIKYKYNIKKR